MALSCHAPFGLCRNLRRDNRAGQSKRNQSTHMKNKYIITMMAVAAVVASPSAWAQMSGNNMLFQPTGDLSSGTQNGHVGVVGGVFLTSNTTWPSVNWLGYFDKDGDGLENSHEVALWIQGGPGGSSLVPVASVTIPAGTVAPLVNGYRWVELPETVGLWYSSWYVLGATTDGVDTWGDLLDGNAGQVTWDADFVGDNAGWTRAGRYDWEWTWPNPPAGQAGENAIYPVANMGYNIVVPEPAAATLLLLGAFTLWGRNRSRHT
jgi:hypothetical protein